MAQQCGQMTGVLRGSNAYLVWGAIKSVWALAQRWWAAQRQRLALAERVAQQGKPHIFKGHRQR